MEWHYIMYSASSPHSSSPQATNELWITYSHNLWRCIEPSCGGRKHVAVFGRSVVILVWVIPIRLLTVLLVVGRSGHIQLIPFHQRSRSHWCTTEWMFLNSLEPAWSRPICLNMSSFKHACLFSLHGLFGEFCRQTCNLTIIVSSRS